MRKLWLWWHIRNCKQNWKINLRLYLYLFGTGMEDQLNFNGWFTRSSVPRRATFFDGQKQTWSRGRVMITWYINFKSSSNPDRKCLQKRTIIVSIFWIDRSPWNGPNPVFTVIYKSALVIIHLFCRTYERKVSSIKYLKYTEFKCFDLGTKPSTQDFFRG